MSIPRRPLPILMLFLISYLAVAVFFYEITIFISVCLKSVGFSHVKIIQSFLFFSLSFSMIGFQIFGEYKKDKGFENFFKRSYLYSKLNQGDSQAIISPRFGPMYQQAGKWIRDNLKVDSKIMAHRLVDLYSLYFYSTAHFQAFKTPIVFLDKSKNVESQKIRGNVIEISSRYSNVGIHNKLSVLSEQMLFDSLRESSIEYIIVDTKQNYLSLYFDNSESFAKVKEFGDGETKIYKVLDLQKTKKLKPMLSRHAKRYLKKLHRKDPETFNSYKEQLLGNISGWDQRHIDQLAGKGGNEPELFLLVEKNRIY